MPNRARDHALDGLRGVAALVVVVHHSLLVTQLFSGPTAGERADPSIAWFVYSPLHIVWAGGEAVFLFFILSGLVLTLPALRGTRFDWASYYPSRLIRIYLPIWAAVALAAVIVAVFPRSASPGDSTWVQAHSETVTLTRLIEDLTVVTGTSGINSALWSLQWEIIFSLLLPVYIWIGVRFSRFWYVVVGGSVALIMLGIATQIHALQFLPMFMIGVVIAARLPQIRAFGERVNILPKSGLIWAVLAIAAWLATTSHWTVSAVSGRGIFRLVMVLVVLGAAGCVILAIIWPAGRQALEKGPMQFLGKVSFSLYLTHEPIVLATAQLLPGDWKGLTILIALPMALLVSWFFYRLIEAPSHRLAQTVRRRVSGTTVRQTRTDVPDTVEIPRLADRK